MKQYKIKVNGDDNEYPVHQLSEMTYVIWKTLSNVPFTMTYETRKVLEYLETGHWIKVDDDLKSPNLFNLNEL